MGGNCFQKNKERGPWFEIQTVKEVIAMKEARGKDSSFERSLLESWSHFHGWKKASIG